MGCTSSSPAAAPGSTAAAGNGSLKNGSVIEQANGIVGSATSNGHGNGSLDPDKMKSMNDMLTDAANLDAQSVKKDLEEVGENLREAVEGGTQMLMEEFSKDAQESGKDETTTELTSVPANPENPNPEELNHTPVEPGGSDESKPADPGTEGEAEPPPVKDEAENVQDGGAEPSLSEAEKAEAESSEQPQSTEEEKPPEGAASSEQS